ncbi:DUF4083 family protein [Bacillus solimangrovi]|uniref:DUF4083 family protein n=1 Tax=Bacillus solimangrovi TaxID=1305675 RepID=UPI0009F4C846|nr:DUF4083 family protein [Bacillus solimangrovi]
MSSLFSLLPLLIMICLFVLCIVSFSLFIRRLLTNSTVKANHSVEIDKKLDKIIELLEENKKH